MPTQSPTTDITPIKTNLFRFLNITNPSLTKRDNKSILVNGPTSTSHFRDGLASFTTQAALDTELSSRIESFTPYASVQAIKDVNPNLQKLGEWMDTHKNQLTLADVEAKTTGVNALASGDEETIWDNIYYQALTNESEARRDLCIQILRANKFLTAYTDMGQVSDEFSNAQKDLLESACNAYVVIPERLVVREKLDLTNLNNPINSGTTSHLDDLAACDISRFRIAQYETACNELDCAQTTYRKEYTQEYNNAYQDYLDAESEEPFEFTPSNQFDDTYIASKVSTPTNFLYLENKSDCATEVDEVIIKLNEKSKEEFQNIVKHTKGKRQFIIFNDVVIPDTNKPLANCISVNAVKLFANSNLHTIFVTQCFDNQNTKAMGIDLTVDFGGDVTSNSKSKKAQGESDNHVTYQLFPSGVAITPEQNSLELNLDYAFRESNFDASSVMTAFDPKGPIYGKIPLPNEQNAYNDGLPGNNRTPLFGVTKVGVGEFMRVEQEVCCYVPGLVSHIENIMAREYKEKATRSLNRTETTTEESTERESEKQTDTSTTDRYELHSEVSKVLQQDRSVQLGASVGVTAKFGNDNTINTNINADTTFSSSSTNSFNLAETKAKEVTTKATERILQKVSYKRTSKMLEEFEDTNKHGFDNREGTTHVTGIYRWVDILYKNNLYNYGKRLIYDFVVPEPSKNFKWWMTHNNGLDKSLQFIKEPDNPTIAPYNILGPSNITRTNYAQLAALYGAEVAVCPPEQLEIGYSFSESPNNGGVVVDKVITSSYKYELKIPEGYRCRYFKYAGNIFRGVKDQEVDWSDLATMELKIANHANIAECYIHHRSKNIDHMGSFVDIFGDISQDLSFTINTRNVGSFTVNVLLRCNFSPDAFIAWQNSTYLSIMTAYNKRLKEYTDAMKSVSSSSDSTQIDYSLNPDMARAIEQRELKRLCIELMTAPFGISMGSNNYYDKDSNSNHKLQINANFQKHTILSKFFEQAFDWQIMAYLMYPYFWGGEEKWIELIKQSSSADPIFQAFLQSGMCRVSVPVRIGFEKAVMYFLDTGRIWSGADNGLHDGLDGMYLSIADELKVDEGKIVSTWETRLPTTLTILQKDAAPLDENGLPCFLKYQLDGVTPCGCSTNAIAQGNSVLVRDKEVTCATYTNRYTTLLSQYQAIVNTYNESATPSSICADTVSALKVKAQLLSALITAASINGCTTTAMETSLADLNDEITRISALCV